MKELTKEMAKEYASKLMFNIKDEELDILVNEFQIMATQLEHLDKIKGISKVLPMTFPFYNDEVNMREDKVDLLLNKDEAFSNCKEIINGEVCVPKVVE